MLASAKRQTEKVGKWVNMLEHWEAKKPDASSINYKITALNKIQNYVDVSMKAE